MSSPMMNKIFGFLSFGLPFGWASAASAGTAANRSAAPAASNDKLVLMSFSFMVLVALFRFQFLALVPGFSAPASFMFVWFEDSLQLLDASAALICRRDGVLRPVAPEGDWVLSIPQWYDRVPRVVPRSRNAGCQETAASRASYNHRPLYC